MKKENLFVLDASALIAIIGQEVGWRIVDRVLETGRGISTPIALVEAFGSARRKRGMNRGEVSTMLTGLGLRIEPLIEQDADEIDIILERAELAAARLGSPRQLSIADAACLALGRRLDAKVVFSDSFWEIIDLPGIQITPFR